MEQERKSKDGFNFSVQGNMGDGLAADEELCASSIGEMEETADVVVLVIAGEEPLGFGDRKAKDGERNRLAETVSV